MGDSDEEYERRRGRDKFRRERNDYQERGGRGENDRNRREEWTDRREVWPRERPPRRDYREYEQRRRYSPPRHDISPPAKRMRREWDGADSGGTGTSGGGANNSGGAGPTQPPMMTFKQFLATQDDGISDKEAVAKYNDYKLDFKKQQLTDFFNTHKEEEWFKWKYHPEEYARRKQEQESGLKKRLSVFMELVETDYFTQLSIDADKATEILKFLDAVVIRLEGGDENDLKILDQVTYNEARADSFGYQEKRGEEEEDESDQEDKTNEAHKVKQGVNARCEDQDAENKAGGGEEGEEVEEEGGIKMDESEEAENQTENKRKRKYKYENEEDSRSDSESENDGAAPDEDSVTTTADDGKPEEAPEIGDEEQEEEDEDGERPEPEEIADTASVKEENAAQVGAAPRPSKPRALHQTCSIFLRYLAPSITRAEVEAICKRYPGFLRVAIADPQPERRFFRRGWISFERDVNIKDICWNLNNMRLRDCELGAIVNRDLSRRIRPGSHLAVHKQVVRSDIKLAARIIQNLDARHSLWDEGGASDRKKESVARDLASFSLASKNPLLHNITDYLIEEASAEEEELLGGKLDVTSDKMDGDKEEQAPGEVSLERDDSLVRVLDRLLMYLRIVHSVDYYNASEYPNEDEMPNRCGIMHARTMPPVNRLSEHEIEEYVSSFESKMAAFLAEVETLSEDEVLKLGKKEVKGELEKFVASNTQELAADKWLCPLSGKKFKAPEFVRKHIFNKHAERVEEVKKEVEYFNNYLRDPKRPQLPAHQPRGSGAGGASEFGRNNNYSHVSSGGGGGYHNQQSYSGSNRVSQGGGGYSGYGSQSYGRGGYNSGYNRGGSQYYYDRRAQAAVAAATGGAARRGGRDPRDPRELINYRDLDAPDVNDAF